MNLDSILEEGRQRMLQRGYSRGRVDEIFAGREASILRDRVVTRIESAVEEAISGASSLGSRAAEYIDGLYLDESFHGAVRLAITDSAKHLEDGYGGYDMKPGLLKNAKVSKEGKLYKVVPMGKKDVGDAERASSSKMFDIRSTGDQLAMDGGRSLSDVVSAMQRMVNPGKTPTRKVDASEFRTVTPDSEGWQNPGFSGLQQLDRINQNLQNDLESIVRDFVEAY